MICQKCQHHEATVHVQEITGKQKTTQHLCAACAAAHGFKDGPISELDLAKLVLNLTAAAEETAEAPQAAGSGAAAITCPACGLTSEDFRKHGRLGCSECYVAFDAALKPLLTGLHRATRHQGKLPGQSPVPPAPAVPREPDLSILETELAKAVDAEAYERAAALRDRIQQLRRHPVAPL